MISDKDRVYTGHILECAALIQHYTRNGKVDFNSKFPHSGCGTTALTDNGRIDPAAV